MVFQSDINIFIKDFVKDLQNGNASAFLGAGFSMQAGYVNWNGLLSEIAEDLGLNIEKERDLISIAQFHVNENKTRSKLNRKILEEFTEESVETENHRLLAKLPISSLWTTNYDKLLEQSFLKENKVIDVKYNNKQLLTSRPKRDIIIYKMHGDIDHPDDAIITKEQYEQYHQTHEPFLNALTGDLITKTFLFIGFSFTDPNLDYVLSRLNYKFKESKRQHYCLSKKPALGDSLNPDQATLDYNLRRQALVINDLKRYGIKTLLLENYSEITEILAEIEKQYRKKTIFISGSAEIYDPYSREEANIFIHKLTKLLVEQDFTIINGFGWGVGSSVINGALDAIYSNPSKYSESQLILKPFPQFESSEVKLKDLWEEYRKKMISKSGISIFIFGNKSQDSKIINANGVLREYEISNQNGNICIPIGITGYTSEIIYKDIVDNFENYSPEYKDIVPFIQKLGDKTISLTGILDLFKNFNTILKR